MKKELETWHFGMDNDRLVNLVLEGKKTATCCLYDENDTSYVGEESILVFEDGTKACITKTKEIIITEFKNITEELALLEGEGNFENWRQVHIDYFKKINPNFNEDTKILFEIFEVTK